MRNKIRKIVTVFLIIAFISSGNLPLSFSQNPAMANTGLNLVLQSRPLMSPVLRGIRVDPSNPFKFDFILDKGTENYDTSVMREETQKIIKYFLASLTIPEADLWVNLSPYENDRIVPNELGNTTMGQEMLAQDYLLKQLAASLTYPETPQGKEYWNALRNLKSQISNLKSEDQSFNKVWIVPDKAVVYEDGLHAFIATARFKVMTEEDYLAAQKNGSDGRDVIHHVSKEQDTTPQAGQVNRVSATEAFKQHILPIIEKDVNEGKNFAPLRQIYYSLILSAWFKKQLKETAIAAAYFDKKKIKGVDSRDEKAVMRIYNQYLNAFKQGAYNYVKSERVGTRFIASGTKITKRTYFSGGVSLGDVGGSVQYSLFPEVAPVVVNAGRLALVEGSAGDTANGVHETIPQIEARITRLKAIEESSGLSGPQTNDDIAFVERYLAYFHYQGGGQISIAQHALTSSGVRQVRMLSEVERRSRDHRTIAENTLPVTNYLRRNEFFHDFRNILGVIDSSLEYLQRVIKKNNVTKLREQHRALVARYRVLEDIYAKRNFDLAKREDAGLLYEVMLDLEACVMRCLLIASNIEQAVGKNSNPEVLGALRDIDGRKAMIRGKLVYVEMCKLRGDSLGEDADIKVGESIMTILTQWTKQENPVFVTIFHANIDDNAKVWAQPIDMDQLWGIFFGNTYEFAEIRSRLERDEGREYKLVVDITVRQEGDEVVIIISDNAMGIPEDKLTIEQATRLPWIFGKGHSTKDTQGLGLDMALDILNRLHGKIEVDRQHTVSYDKDPSKSGATFIIRLPASVPKETTSEGGVRLKTDNITFVKKGNGISSRLPVKANVQVEGLAYNIECIKNITSAEEFSRLMQ